MDAVLIVADSTRSPEMRHEVPVAVPDPFLYAEQNGRRVAVVTAFETARVTEADPTVEALPPERFGLDELLAGGMNEAEAMLEVYARACRELRITSAVVPAAFPVEVADHLRADGVEVASDRELFEQRRRRKNEAELAGLRRAQRACEAALDAARGLLRSADRSGTLVLDGEQLTSERIKAEVERVFSDHGVYAEEFIVSHGAQTAVAHESGSGAIRPGEPVLFDLFPRDRATGVYSDMTRTYVVGTPDAELVAYHRLCREALERAAEAVRPGVNGRELMQLVCDLFAEHGHATPLTKKPGEVLENGFLHGLGHGVGLEVHERPAIGRAGDDLFAGDVLTLEPGLYRAGYGGIRLEDILVVTENGAEVVTSYPYDLEP
jgi:Xaa-Pro aminopeptidase